MRKPLAFAAAAAGVALATVGVVARPAGAQGYFGQNQVQYDHFDWRVLESEHFLVHYYPAEREAAVDATRMAERSYARLSRVLDHQFREKKPIILFASRADFGQNNVTGDLGEGTGGVTEPLRQRNLFYMPGDYRGTEHVLTHEMVHQFQYDIFSRGKAGANLQALQQNDPPLWFAEGMAEYLSIGPHHPFTDTWVRDAALNGNLPTIEQMTLRPDRYFPYRYGEALWSYIGARWGDEVIGQIMNAVPSIGVERAFKRELGMSLEDLSDEWREAMQTKFLPGVATTERPRKFAQPLLSERRSGGQVFVAPVLSSDGKYVAFLSNGSFLRGEVFIDLWLGDARTGKRIKRLVKSTLNTDAEELGIIYSQSAFSPDAKTLAYSALRKGKEVLYLLNVKKRDVVRRFDLPGVENVSGPSFSPDGKQIVFSGGVGGITDLYVVNVDGTGLRRLTNDRNADVQPQWSPDGRTIAFASDRGPQTDFSVLRYSPWQIALVDVASGRVEVPAGQAGLNLNPVWAPDGRSIAYVSDRTGTQNVFLYDLDRRDHFQLTNVVGGVLSFTEQSPVISWAHQADRLAFTYYENGDMTVWTIDNPRLLRRDPYREPTSPNGGKVIAAAAQAAARDSARLRDSSVAVALAADTTGLALRQRSFYRSPNETVRASAELPAADIRAADTAVVSVARLLDSAALALPDTSKFKDYAYHVGYQPEYVARPSVGYVGGTNFGRGVFGGTTIVLSDLLGNNRLAFSGQVNGRVSEAQLFAGYTNLSHHLQYTTGVMQAPYYVLYGQGYGAGRAAGLLTEETDIVRYLVRDVFLVGMYPFSRFTRFELGTEFSNVDRAVQRIGRDVIETTGQPYSDYYYIEQKNLSSFNYAAPFAGWVSDNALFGYTGPIMGRRYHFQVQPTIGSFRWIDYLADYRRYDPILFNFLTVATRVGADISVGRDEMALPKYLGSPQSNFWLRGYDRQNFFSTIGCNQGTFGVNAACGAPQMIGSRVVLASAELRFPLVRRFDLGLLPVSLPPLDGLIFYDAGMAWQGGQTAHFLRPPNDYDPALDRYLLTSYGAGLRLNLFNFALLRWDYAIPIDQPNHKGFWQFSLGPSF